MPADFGAVRLNHAGLGSVEPFRDLLKHLGDLASRLTDFGWHIETHLPPALFEEVVGDEALGRLPIVADHFGLSLVADADTETVTRRMRCLLDSGRLWIKLSAPYRLGKGDAGLERAARATETYLAGNPERLLWASDWPHTPPHPKNTSAEQVIPFRDIDPADLLRFFGSTVLRRDQIRRILVDNPERLFGVE